jgi:hypothetical protein
MVCVLAALGISRDREGGCCFGQYCLCGSTADGASGSDGPKERAGECRPPERTPGTLRS